MSTWTNLTKQSEFTATNQAKNSTAWSKSETLGFLLQESGDFLLQEDGYRFIVGIRQNNIPTYSNQVKN
jgi:hypothetical protein